jgi:predicted kinase
MRKWMRERLQRRKKTSTDTSAQPAPPPLQPAYFDTEQEPAAALDEKTEGKIAESEVSKSSRPREETEPAKEPRVDEAAGEEPSGEKARRGATSNRSAGSAVRNRRRRGGRGRGNRGREQAVAQAFAPSGAKGATSAPPVEPAEEIQPGDNEFADAAEAESSPPAAAAAQPKAPVVPSAPQRPPKGIVVLAIGLPGSGKSSWFKRHNIVPLSSDMVRSLLFDDVREQRYQDLVFSNLRSMLKARLIAKRPMNYVDATNLTPQERQHWIKLAKDYQYEVHAVFFDVPLEVCIERHARRDRVVPEDVMRRMAAKLKPPTFEEGFAKITVVRVKKKEGAE